MAPHNKMYALITVHSMLNYCMRPLIPPLAEFIEMLSTHQSMRR